MNFECWIALKLSVFLISLRDKDEIIPEKLKSSCTKHFETYHCKQYCCCCKTVICHEHFSLMGYALTDTKLS